MNTTLEWFDHLAVLYGVRNAFYHQSRGERMRCLLSHMPYLENISRGRWPQEKAGTVLAYTFGWAFAFARTYEYNGPSILEALMRKYPAAGCYYCGHKPCGCETNRAEKIEGGSLPVDRAQFLWTPNEWVAHCRAVYGENNRRQPHSLQFGYFRLCSEIIEFTTADLRHAHDVNFTSNDISNLVIKECADVFAWIFSNADLYGLDLGAELTLAFPSVCDICNQRPCRCPSHLLLPVNGNLNPRLQRQSPRT